MISPYRAPNATFNHETLALDALRWRGAVYFAFIPMLFMLFMQGSVIYSRAHPGPLYWHSRIVEPLLFCAPVCLIMAATGYAVAVKCLSRGVGTIIVLGCVVGAAWALVAMLAGHTIALLNGATHLTLERVIRILMVMTSIFVPLGVVLCLFTRWRGNRLGVGNAPD